MGNKTVKLLLYCTKAKPYLAESAMFGMVENHNDYELYSFKPIKNKIDVSLNGKIVAEAECDLVEKIKFINDTEYRTNTLTQNDLLKESCLGMLDLYEYLYVKDGYAIYLKNVKPFAEPRELNYYGIKRAPQNMCYLYDENGNIIAVVISIQAPHLCNIMNDDKTIEVRKSILNIFKELIPNERN